MEVKHLSTPQWFFTLLMPGIMINVQIICFVLAALLHPSLTLNLKIDALRSKAFAYFWAVGGRTLSRDFPSPHLDNIITQHCRGRVLDIGPGSGMQLDRFGPSFKAGQIDEIYAVEPGVEMHDQLRREAVKVFGSAAMSTYKVLTCGAQPDELVPVLARQGLLRHGNEGVFDTIVCIRALCGIPRPQETADLFYRLLKPGGHVIFFEHVVNSGDAGRSGSTIARTAQYLYMGLGWSFWAGGCELTRDTALTFRRAAAGDGGWAEEKVVDRSPEGCIPEIWGFLRKREHT